MARQKPARSPPFKHLAARHYRVLILSLVGIAAVSFGRHRRHPPPSSRRAAYPRRRQSANPAGAAAARQVHAGCQAGTSLLGVPHLVPRPHADRAGAGPWIGSWAQVRANPWVLTARTRKRDG